MQHTKYISYNDEDWWHASADHMNDQKKAIIWEEWENGNTSQKGRGRRDRWVIPVVEDKLVQKAG